MEVKAKGRFIKTGPRKLRLVCRLIKNKKLKEAETQLRFLKKEAASPLLSLLKSAEAAAKEKDLKVEDLYIKEIRVDEGPSLKRWLFRSRGRASPIKKRMSHISLVLSEQPK